MNQSVERLNQLPASEAQAEFLKCCGSARWAREMSRARPFENAETLLTKAEAIWWLLSKEDWLEAFHAHPRIGEKKAVTVQSPQAQNWSAQEQSGVAIAAPETIAELAQRNREYEDRFGFIFIVCAAGKSSQEMLSIINSRIDNDRDAELRIAAEEQRKITRLRLEKLLKQ